MINQEKIEQIYEGIINGEELSTKNLKSYGFHSADIKNLIDQGLIERIQRGHYVLKDIEQLFHYGKELIARKEKEKATACFKMCYLLDETHKGTNFQLFLRSIEEKEYQTAFRYFDAIYDTDNPYYFTDSNLYLYLLSMVTELPEKYKESTRTLKLADIKVDWKDQRYRDIKDQNQIRQAIYYQKFPFAFQQLNQLIGKHDQKYSPQDVIIKELLVQAMEKEAEYKNKVFQCIASKNWEELVDLLKQKESLHPLSRNDAYLLANGEVLLELKNGTRSPYQDISFRKTENFFEASQNHNYALALSLSEKYHTNHGFSPRENACHLLLEAIVQEEALLTQGGQEEKIEQLDEAVEEKKQIKQDASSLSEAFVSIVQHLLHQEVDSSIPKLHQYLKDINKEEYISFMDNLLRISTLERDETFIRPLVALTYLETDSFQVDITGYLQSFYESITQDDSVKAKLYLNVLTNLKELGKTDIATEKLERVFASLSQQEKTVLVERQEAKEVDVLPHQQEEKQVEIPTYKKEELSPSKKKEESDQELLNIALQSGSSLHQTAVKKLFNTMPELMHKDYDDRMFIAKKHIELEEGKDLILLRPMSDERIEQIHQIASVFPDIASFTIEVDGKKQAVLRYRYYSPDFVDVKEVCKEATRAYQEHDYNKALEAYQQLFVLKEPKSYVYAGIGLIHMKKKNIEEAIDYLTVATALSAKECVHQTSQQYDFSDLILALKGNGAPSEEEKKPYFKMRLSEFEDDTNDYYGIENLEEIATLIHETGLDVTTACTNLGLNQEQISLVQLIFARECYVNEKYQKGDQFLKKVEQTKEKTPLVKHLVEETRLNKRFYKNRKSAESPDGTKTYIIKPPIASSKQS